VASLALFAWIALATAWSSAPWAGAFGNLWQYRKLLIIALMLSVVDDPRWAWRAFLAFLAGTAVALAVSYLRWFKVLPDMGGRGMYAGFGGHTGFSVVIAFAAFAMVWLWQLQPRLRPLWGVLGVLAVFNLMFVNTGRTGQLAFLCLIPLLLHRWWRLKGVLAGMVAALVLALSAYAGSPTFRTNTQSAYSDLQAYARGMTYTSNGLRLEFWQNTLNLICTHPIFGGGTGSFREEYGELAAQQNLTGDYVATNPHNEYLLVWSQQGTIGLSLLLWLWATQWRRAYLLEDAERYLTHALIVIMVVGDLFNSFLLDNFEGHFYALMSVALAVSWPRSSARVEARAP
jgi:O-antigen ligase